MSPWPTGIRRAFRASLLGLLAALPVRLEAQCTLAGSLVSFEPNPPGVSRGGTPFLGSGFSNNLALYRPGGTGPYRLLMRESYGYSVLDLSTPTNPPRSTTTTCASRSTERTASHTTATDRTTSRRSP